MRVHPEVLHFIPDELVIRYQILPLKVENEVLTVAMTPPFDAQFIDDLQNLINYEIYPVAAAEEDIRQGIKKHYNVVFDNREKLQEQKADYKHEEKPGEVSILVNNIIKKGVDEGASDIHLEPTETGWQIRYRIDGLLRQLTKPYSVSFRAIISSVKILAGLDIAEHRIPLEGRFKLDISGRPVHFRVVTMPSIYGEKMVLRILDKTKNLLSLEQLGYEKANLRLIKGLIEKPHGLILITGPTGSGKTTTLYSILSELTSSEKSITTLEEPVEYNLQGITQVSVGQSQGLTYPVGLKSLLRQDPDIIMVGEIRDEETAEIAVRAATTGHLVLSTLHTNDAPGAVTRLLEMSIKPFLISASLIGVISQRLIRLKCDCCNTQKTVNEELGCINCNYTQFNGRTSVEEVLLITEELKRIINENYREDAMVKVARKSGYTPLIEQGLDMVRKGATTEAEVMRVICT